MSDKAQAQAPIFPDIRGNDPSIELKKCDIIMRGGIVSGVVYPRAIAKLSGTYRFCGLGGTSSGAMAAAAAAAAELGWQSGRNRDSFTQMQDEVDALSLCTGKPGETRLFHLFQPQPATKALFHTLVDSLSSGSPNVQSSDPKDKSQGKSQGSGPKIGHFLTSALRHHPLALLGALPGLLLAVLLGLWADFLYQSLLGEAIYAIGLIYAFLFAALGVVATLLALIAWQAIYLIPDNDFGLCSGYAPPQAGKPRALTVWLSEVLDKLAGQTNCGKPLTFGDLDAHEIKLKLVTTCLTQERPYELPFKDTEKEGDHFYFDPDEFRKFFPECVVQWMEKNPGVAGGEEVTFNNRKLVKFPCRANIPVVVAARLSLSFPILLSMIPLYAVHPADRTTGDKPRKAERCWFSDGGISTNFPIHFFDNPLPRWPTFGISLRDFDRNFPVSDQSDEWVWMPDNNDDYDNKAWKDLDVGKEGRLFTFGGMIINTMRNWSDNLQTQVHGYRDRVAHIYLENHEGGLNLKMDASVTKGLHGRGVAVATKFLNRFADPNTDKVLSWKNHRWVRYRSTMSLLEEMLSMLQKGYDWPESDGSTFVQLLERAEGEAPEKYWLNRERQVYTKELMGKLAQLVTDSQTNDNSLIPGSPAPKPVLQIRPDL